MAETLCKKNQKYDELEQSGSSESRRIGNRKPVYLEYDATGRKKRSTNENRNN